MKEIESLRTTTLPGAFGHCLVVAQVAQPAVAQCFYSTSYLHWDIGCSACGQESLCVGLAGAGGELPPGRRRQSCGHPAICVGAEFRLSLSGRRPTRHARPGNELGGNGASSTSKNFRPLSKNIPMPSARKSKRSSAPAITRSWVRLGQLAGRGGPTAGPHQHPCGRAARQTGGRAGVSRPLQPRGGDIYFEKGRLPARPAGRGIGLDNARCHHSPTTRRLGQAAGCQLFFLPAYSPDPTPSNIAAVRISNVNKSVRAKVDSVMKRGFAGGELDVRRLWVRGREC